MEVRKWFNLTCCANTQDSSGLKLNKKHLPGNIGQYHFLGGGATGLLFFQDYQLMGINLAMTISRCAIKTQVNMAFWKDPNRRQSFPFKMVPFQVTFVTRWWFQIFFMFTSILGNDPIRLKLFKWVETTNQVSFWRVLGGRTNPVVIQTIPPTSFEMPSYQVLMWTKLSLRKRQGREDPGRNPSNKLSLFPL